MIANPFQSPETRRAQVIALHEARRQNRCTAVRKAVRGEHASGGCF